MPPLSASNMTASLDAQRFEMLARTRLLTSPPSLNGAQSSGDDELNPNAGKFPDNLRHAAVLIPIVAHNPLTVILTERMGHLSAHAGQIAFPGGKIETTDASPLAAALRETREEIALDHAFIEPLGYLPTYRTGTGFVITPSVALVRPGFTLVADPSEVARIFEVPLQFLMNDSNHRIDTRQWRGSERRFYAMPYNEYYIWGATAGIIRLLFRRLFDV